MQLLYAVGNIGMGVDATQRGCASNGAVEVEEGSVCGVPKVIIINMLMPIQKNSFTLLRVLSTGTHCSCGGTLPPAAQRDDSPLTTHPWVIFFFFFFTDRGILACSN
jgi:hypothetical protein